jgi:hypothetical protein
MGGGPITKEHARKLIKKLGAVDETQKADVHDMWVVYHNGEMVASFGIRRGSRKDISHPHIPGDLGVNERFVKDMASCTKSLDDWLRKRGFIKEDEEGEGEKETETQ